MRHLTGLPTCLLFACVFQSQQPDAFAQLTGRSRELAGILSFETAQTGEGWPGGWGGGPPGTIFTDNKVVHTAFVVFALGSLLVQKETPFARFTGGDTSNPGAFHFTPPISLAPGKPHYGGKVVIIVDEVSQSQAEYTAMALRASPLATVVGSTTAGADGNVSRVPLLGGLSCGMSGIGVFYPDKKPTQRFGILPDVEVEPTIAGIRAGRDEVLEAAIRQIVGADIAAAQIEQMARH